MEDGTPRPLVCRAQGGVRGTLGLLHAAGGVHDAAERSARRPPPGASRGTRGRNAARTRGDLALLLRATDRPLSPDDLPVASRLRIDRPSGSQVARSRRRVALWGLLVR